jgi:C1A family cysteine protease
LSELKKDSQKNKSTKTTQTKNKMKRLMSYFQTPPQTPSRKYGWNNSRPDPRDKKFKNFKVSTIPSKINLQDKFPAIYDQGQLGSCTSNALAAIFEYDQMKQNLKVFIPSRLFIYYCERVLEGSVDYDAGASLRDGMLVLNNPGVCDEKDWPYDIRKFNQKPPEKAYTHALLNHSVNYYSVDPNVESFKAAVASGFPVVFGFSVPESFEHEDSAETGFMKIPSLNENIIGGHAVVVCGYDDDLQHDGNRGYFLVRNSWGSEWGLKGYFWMPYDFVNSNYCDDCWVLETVVEAAVEELKAELL